MTIHFYPVKAQLAAANHLQAVIAPPYDVVTREEVKAAVQDNPRHFLNVTRPEAMMDSTIAFDDPRVYQAAHDHWQAFLDEGLFHSDEAPHFYIYGMRDKWGQQYGVVSLISVHDYESGKIRKHELTRPDKENDRVRHLQAVNGQLSPVLLAVKDTGEIFDLLQSQASVPADLSADLNGVRHELWIVRSPEVEAKIQDLFQSKQCLYVADGHHRSAAALRAHQEYGLPPYCFAVTFPSQHMRILGYHRTVRDLNGLTEAEFLKALESHYEVQPLSELSLPAHPGVVHMQLGSRAYALSRRDLDESDPVLSLDVSALSRYVLTPVLGIEDLRTDKRIGFIGGLKAVHEIQDSTARGEIAVGFLMYPTQPEELLRVADAHLLMPPKSTWFEPKLADGLLAFTY